MPWSSHALRLLPAVLLVAGAAAWLAPYLDAELIPWRSRTVLVDAATPALVRGHMVDDYFAVEALGPGVYALGEPRYWQQNYSYLILGEQRAVLFDAGSGTRDLSAVVRRLTPLPVTVLVSHLHYDHLGGIGAFEHMAALDVPAIRQSVAAGVLTPSRYQYLGFFEKRAPPSTRISEWWAPGAQIDLGGRRLTVLATPGHTPDSAALWDADRHALYIGDFIYPSTLYAFLPGASRAAYRATTARLLAMLPADAALYTAHCCRADEGVAAPRLGVMDLQDLGRALQAIDAGHALATGFYPRTYAVNGLMTFAAGFPWNNR